MTGATKNSSHRNFNVFPWSYVKTRTENVNCSLSFIASFYLRMATVIVKKKIGLFLHLHQVNTVKLLLHSFSKYLTTVKISLYEEELHIQIPCFNSSKTISKKTQLTETFGLFPSYSFYLNNFLVKKVFLRSSHQFYVYSLRRLDVKIQ